MLERLIAWIDRLDHIHALRSLDDRLLDDMGVARTEIPKRVRGSAAGAVEGGLSPVGEMPARGACRDLAAWRRRWLA